MSRFHKVPYTVPFLKCVETFGCTTIPVIMNPNHHHCYTSSPLTMMLWLIMAFSQFHFFFSKKDNTLASACTVIFKILAYFLQFQQYMSTHVFSNLLQYCSNIVCLTDCLPWWCMAERLFFICSNIQDIMIMWKIFICLKTAIEHLFTALNVKPCYYLSYSFKYVEIQQIFGGKIANKKFLISP